MATRLSRLGIVLAVLGLAFIAASGYAYVKVQEGTKSLNAFSAAQDVKLAYNDQGQLVDRGDPAAAQGIMTVLTQEWGYPVVASDFNPNDPVVNTASEYMFQLATITHHIRDGVQTVTLTEDYTAPDGTVYTAGVPYEIPVAGRYFSQFDRTNPIDAAVREQAWSPLGLALIAQLGVGTVTASSLQLGIGLAGLFAGVGFSFLVAGAGLFWAARPEKVAVTAKQPAMVPVQ
jgi:hypothetical protein